MLIKGRELIGFAIFVLALFAVVYFHGSMKSNWLL